MHPPPKGVIEVVPNQPLYVWTGNFAAQTIGILNKIYITIALPGSNNVRYLRFLSTTISPPEGRCKEETETNNLNIDNTETYRLHLCNIKDGNGQEYANAKTQECGLHSCKATQVQLDRRSKVQRKLWQFKRQMIWHAIRFQGHVGRPLWLNQRRHTTNWAHFSGCPAYKLGTLLIWTATSSFQARRGTQYVRNTHDLICPKQNGQHIMYSIPKKMELVASAVITKN